MLGAYSRIHETGRSGSIWAVKESYRVPFRTSTFTKDFRVLLIPFVSRLGSLQIESSLSHTVWVSCKLTSGCKNIR